MMAAASSSTPQAACSTIIQSGSGSKKSTPTTAMRMTTPMRSRSSARGLPLAARLAKTNARIAAAAMMMPRIYPSGSTRLGTTIDKPMITQPRAPDRGSPIERPDRLNIYFQEANYNQN
ncbi:hypothetical protein [Saccharopolyspora sp. 5N708]|uniref:hypothetical protein n=1 Tax=Saccharopolyspora sp. 5N708 TaxID=3457424 RepID=UPI003FD208CA